MAVTKIEWGFEPIAGTLLNGRVRSAIQSPLLTRVSVIASALALAIPALPSASNDSLASPSTSMTTDSRARLAPRLMLLTRPAAGAV